MSSTTDQAGCKYCGSVLLVNDMVRVTEDGEYAYACASCAVEAKGRE